MEDDEEKWQLFQQKMKELEEHQKKQPDVFLLCSIGGVIGGFLGPLLLVALFFIDAALHPEGEAGGPLGYLFVLIMSVPAGGIAGAILVPLTGKLIYHFRYSKRQ